MGEPDMSADIVEHVRDLRVPPQGVEYVKQAMAGPSRLVSNTRYRNVTTRFASFKTGEVIQSESHTCELPFLCQLELDDDVLAVYDQPPPVFVEFPDVRGRLHRGKKTPDFLVVRRRSVEVYECKPGKALRDLILEKPDIWVRDQGAYRYLPAERPISNLGFRFIVHNADTIGPVYAANLKLLVNTRRAQVEPLRERELAKAIRVLGKRHGLTIYDLADELHRDDVSPIFASILALDLHTLIRWQLLSALDSTCVYANSELASAAETVLRTHAECDCLGSSAYSAPLALSPKAMEYTKNAIEIIRRIRSGEQRPDRKGYRLLRRISGLSEGQSILSAIAPKFHRRGSHKSLGPDIEAIISEVIDNSYSRRESSSISAAHFILQSELRRRELSPVCYETFRLRVRERSRDKLADARSGWRASNAACPPVFSEDAAIPANFAWERAHIDSTILDEAIWLACPLSKILARPTIYILVDEYSSKLLAYWVCFGDAGRQAVSCLLRDCIRRHRKLPCEIIHDLGSEFLSVFYETFNAAFVIDLKRRPRGAPRWGSHVESAFNRINKLIVHRLSGNTLNDKLGRQTTSRKRSRAHARHNLLGLLDILEDGLMSWLNNRPVGVEVASPDERFEYSAARFASIARSAPLTSEILAHTAIPGGTRLIDHARGVIFKHSRYFGPGIADPSFHGKKVHIRWEPYNPSILYARANSSWVRLTTRDFGRYEHAGHQFQLAQLYLRHDTAWSAKQARMDADAMMAAKIHQDLSIPPPSEPVRDTDAFIPSQGDIFDAARSLAVDALQLEVDHEA